MSGLLRDRLRDAKSVIVSIDGKTIRSIAAKSILGASTSRLRTGPGEGIILLQVAAGRRRLNGYPRFSDGRPPRCSQSAGI